MIGSFQKHLQQQLSDIRSAGTYKHERVILTPQGTTIRAADGASQQCHHSALADSLSPRGTSGERAGERGSQTQRGPSERAPLPYPLPTPSSWGEGILPGEFGGRVQGRVADGQPVLNLCANNYLGLAQHPAVRQAAHDALDLWGYGCASVRFICGTQGVHKELEQRLSEFLGAEDTILYSSCFDANGGLFETLLGVEDAVISDELNHASIIDGIRLSKAQRFRYRNNDMADLEAKLLEAKNARFRLIATDGVFSMDGSLANLAAICDLAERYNALVMVDDSHAVG